MSISRGAVRTGVLKPKVVGSEEFLEWASWNSEALGTSPATDSPTWRSSGSLVLKTVPVDMQVTRASRPVHPPPAPPPAGSAAPPGGYSLGRPQAHRPLLRFLSRLSSGRLWQVHTAPSGCIISGLRATMPGLLRFPTPKHSPPAPSSLAPLLPTPRTHPSTPTLGPPRQPWVPARQPGGRPPPPSHRHVP